MDWIHVAPPLELPRAVIVDDDDGAGQLVIQRWRYSLLCDGGGGEIRLTAIAAMN